MKRQWENEELVEYWILSPWDLAQVGNKTGTTRLGFAVLLKFQCEGRFPQGHGPPDPQATRIQTTGTLQVYARTLDAVNRLNYEVCVLQALRERVRVREIWVMGASHYRNPDNDMPTDFSQKRNIYYEALHQPTEAGTFIEQIKGDMRKALLLLDVAIPRILNKVNLLPNRKKTDLSLPA